MSRADWICRLDEHLVQSSLRQRLLHCILRDLDIGIDKYEYICFLCVWVFLRFDILASAREEAFLFMLALSFILYCFEFCMLSATRLDSLNIFRALGPLDWLFSFCLRLFFWCIECSLEVGIGSNACFKVLCEVLLFFRISSSCKGVYMLGLLKVYHSYALCLSILHTWYVGFL